MRMYPRFSVALVLIVLFAFAVVPVPLSTPSPQNGGDGSDIEVTWTLVHDGISKRVYDIEIRNLSDVQRIVDVRGQISNANFPMSDLHNIKFYVWNGIMENIQMPDWDNVNYDWLIEGVENIEIISHPENVDYGDMDSKFYAPAKDEIIIPTHNGRCIIFYARRPRRVKK